MNKIKGLNRFTVVLAKVIELLYWIAAGFIAALLVLSLAAKGWLAEQLSRGQQALNIHENVLTTHGFELTVVQNGSIDMRAVALFCTGSAAILVLMALIFHTIWRMMKEIGDAPGEKSFQLETARRVKHIGFLFLGIPAVSLAVSALAALILGPENSEVSVGLEYLLLGLLMLYLAQIFSYGAGMQQELDGLV